MSFFVHNAEIIFLELKEENSDSKVIYRTTSNYDLLIKKHSDKLNMEVDKNHGYFNPSELVVVGFSCGYLGEAPKLFYEIEELIEHENKEELVNWCKSISPEIRCYGSIGLNFLKEKGIDLNPNEIGLLESISRENTMVYYCSGCTEWGPWKSLAEMFHMGTKYLNQKSK